MFACKNFRTAKTGYGVFAFVFAVALQVQVTVFASGDYLGLRVSLADILLPFAGVLILLSLLLGKTSWPGWKQPFGYWAVILPSLAIIAAVINGYVLSGQWSPWAVVNKCAGWFILMGYLGAGAWLARNAPRPAILLFACSFTGFFLISSVYDLILHYLSWEVAADFSDLHIKGFMYNRNAYAFLMLAVIGIIPMLGHQSPHARAFHFILWLVIGMCVVLNASRALWLCFFLALIVLGVQNRVQNKGYVFKTALPAALIGILAAFLLFNHYTSWIMRPFNQTAVTLTGQEILKVHSPRGNILKTYDQPRIQILKNSLALYHDHPLSGAGLGSILKHQEGVDSRKTAVLDNSVLWILTEMGPFGLFAFLWVYLAMLGALYNKDGPADDVFEHIARAALFLLLFFGVFSMFHEILYTRFMWFILGMALSVPIARQQQPAQRGFRAFAGRRAWKNRRFGRRKKFLRAPIRDL